MIKKIISKIESKHIELSELFFVFLSIVFARYLLESVLGLGLDNKLLPISSLFHYIVWYGVVILIISVFLSYILKSEIFNIIKIAIYFLPIILLSPLLSWFIGESIISSTSYLSAMSITQLIESILGFFFGMSSNFGIGIRIEIGLICIGLFLYSLLKTKKIKIAITSVLILFLIIFVFGSLPSLFLILQNSNNLYPLAYNLDLFYNNLTHIIGAQNYVSDYSQISLNIWLDILWTIPLILIAIPFMFLFMRLYKKNIYIAIIKNIRWNRIIYYMTMMALGMFIAYSIHPTTIPIIPINIFSVILAFTSVVLFFVSTCFQNDIYDLDADRISNPNRPLVNDLITTKQSFHIYLLLGVLSLLSMFTINFISFIFVLFAFIIAFLYSTPFLYLKKYLFLNSLLISLAHISIVLAGFYMIWPTASFLDFPISMFWSILLVIFLFSNIKDIKDIKGDKEQKIQTFPVLLGEVWGKIIISVFILLGYLIISLSAQIKELYFISLIIGAFQIWLINKKEYSEKYIILTSFIFIFSAAYLALTK